VTQSYTLILGAMEQEIQAIVTALRSAERIGEPHMGLHRGTLEGKPVIVCRSGVGKVLATMRMQQLIDTHKLDRVIFTGVAGAIRQNLAPGDVIIGSRLIQHDMDATALGFEIGQIPFTPYRFFEGDYDLLACAQSVAAKEDRVFFGCIGTGDRFVTEPEPLRELGIDCVDMEGCAIAMVCSIQQIPSLIIRIISDYADGSASADFEKNLPLFANRSLSIIRGILRAF
jgi:adenosylhomocysteine nucleosidase